MAVKPHFSWPNILVEIPYNEWKITLQPQRDNLAYTVSVFDERGLTIEKGGEILSRFLSCLAWSYNGGIVELFVCGSNNPNNPGLMSQGTYGISGWSQINPPDYFYLPNPQSNDAKLGLALYREAMSINSVPFAFLSYCKILNIKYKDGKAQGSWINKHLDSVWYQPATIRLEQLRNLEPDIGKYMFKQGRCAVAHAYTPSAINPDNYMDKSRLECDLPLIKELASIFIETAFGVPADCTFWKNLKNPSADESCLLRKETTADGKVVYYPTKVMASHT